MNAETFAKDDFIRVRRPYGKQWVKGIVKSVNQVDRWTLVTYQRYRFDRGMIVSAPKVAIVGQDEIERDAQPKVEE